jgi:hypothetical protein
VVGDRERIHALLGGRVDQLSDPPEAVEQAELGVNVEVREIVRSEGRHGRSILPGGGLSGSTLPGIESTLLWPGANHPVRSVDSELVSESRTAAQRLRMES